MKKYNFDIAPFSRAFLENKDKTMAERIALGMLAAADHLEIVFREDMLPTIPTRHSMAVNDAVSYTYDPGFFVDVNKFEQLIEQNPQYADDLREIKEKMAYYATYARWERNLSYTDKRFQDTKACWGGGWSGHGNPDYARFLHLGVNGIRALIQTQRKNHPESEAFYNACDIAMQSISKLGKHISRVAAEYAKTEKDVDKRAEFEKISKTFTRIPDEPAYDMYSATMMFWMMYSFDGCDSPGRFDQFMIDFYRKSPKTEQLDMLRRFLEAIHIERGWNLCISGSDKDWNDQTNELSYDLLRMVKELGYQTPNLTMRVHRNTPQDLWQLATECIGTGIGLPAIYNDEVVCPALEKIGIPAYDSHDYCMNGCNQIEIMGKSRMGLEDGEVNLAKALLFTIHNGYDGKSGNKELSSIPFGNPTDCRTFDEFLALYYKNLDHLTDVATNMANRFQEMFAHFYPDSIRSCLCQGCLESGKDYMFGGPLYNHGQILAEGIADTADSLFAIKKLVFDEKKYTMHQLVLALENNFIGFERLHYDFKNCQKFGNDIPEVDILCAEVVDHFFTYLKTIKTFRGGVFTGGCSTFNRAAAYGSLTAALPNGKLDEDSNFADSIAATPGNDMHGPTALIKSMLHYDQTNACSGMVAQLKFQKTMFNTDKGKETFIQLAKTYFAGGGQQLSINVVDREQLLEALKNPDRYKNLVVRVGGYSDYFCNLPLALKKNIIDRTEFVL